MELCRYFLYILSLGAVALVVAALSRLKRALLQLSLRLENHNRYHPGSSAQESNVAPSPEFPV